MGTARHAAELSIRNVSESLHHRDRAVPRTSWDSCEQLHRREEGPEVLKQRQQSGERRLMVLRSTALEPGREPGYAHGLPVLAGVRGGDRGKAANVVCAVRQ